MGSVSDFGGKDLQNLAVSVPDPTALPAGAPSVRSVSPKTVLPAPFLDIESYPGRGVGDAAVSSTSSRRLRSSTGSGQQRRPSSPAQFSGRGAGGVAGSTALEGAAFSTHGPPREGGGAEDEPEVMCCVVSTPKEPMP